MDTCWSLALDRLRTGTPAAAGLLELAAFCGPDPIPLVWLAPDRLADGPLKTALAAGDLDELVAAVRRYSLARRAGGTIQLHRLVASAIRAHMSADTQAVAAQARRILAAAQPANDCHDLASWPAWAVLTGHVLAAPALDAGQDSAVDDDPAARRLLLAVTDYLQESRGDSTVPTPAADLHRRWTALLGPDHPDTLGAAEHLAADLRALEEREAVRALDEDTLARRRRVLGNARALDEDTLARRRRVLGDDQPSYT